jgi:6-phosphogluconolactonase
MDPTEIKKPELIVTEDLAQFIDIAAKYISSQLEDIAGSKGHVDIALSGGSTPIPVYEKLTLHTYAFHIPWEAIDFYFGDERCVPPDDPDSNFFAAEDSILKYESIKSSQIHRIPADEENLEKVAMEYAAILPDHLDILLLGMGDDGHIASIFPGSILVDEKNAKMAVVKETPRDPKCRITITPIVIENAGKIVVMVSGANKAQMVARAIEGPYNPHEIPAQLALEGTWILDKAAASGLLETKYSISVSQYQ